MAATKRHQEAVSALGAAYQKTDRTLRKLRGRDSHLPQGEIGFSRFELLDVLREAQPISAGDLAVAAGFTAASISRMLEPLVAEGFIERTRSDSDRRVVTVTLTEKGLMTVEARRKVWSARWAAALRGVDEAELDAATKVMGLIATVFEDRDGPDEPS